MANQTTTAKPANAYHIGQQVKYFDTLEQEWIDGIVVGVLYAEPYGHHCEDSIWVQWDGNDSLSRHDADDRDYIVTK